MGHKSGDVATVQLCQSVSVALPSLQGCSQGPIGLCYWKMIN